MLIIKPATGTPADCIGIVLVAAFTVLVDAETALTSKEPMLPPDPIFTPATVTLGFMNIFHDTVSFAFQ